MRQVHATGVAGLLVIVQNELLADLKRHLLVREGTHAQLRTLKISQNGDRSFDATLHVADATHQLAHGVVICVAHVDAEDVCASLIELFDHSLVGGRWTESCYDLYLATTLH